MHGGSSKGKVRYAVVGLGHIAQAAVLPAFKSAANSELFALVSGDPKKLKTLGENYSLKHLYSYRDYGRVLSNVDAVYIALPNHLHREYAVRAAAAGVHVLCEKPMAVSEEECRAMIKAAEQNDVKLMVAYRLHFEAGNLEAIELAKNGQLGHVRFFTSEFAQQVSEENVRVSETPDHGGGPLYDMGVYCINAARYLFRSEPIEVAAFAARKPSDERFSRAEEMVSVNMHFPDERLATFTCSFGAAHVSRYSLFGTKGSLRVDPAYGYATPIGHTLTMGDRTRTRTFPKRDQFAAELFYFSNCILKNKDPEPSGYEGLLDVRVIEAVYEAIRTRKAVRLIYPGEKKKPTSRQQIRRPAHPEPEVIHAKPPSQAA
jgi:glucose-fructose oxidoreductase